MKKTYVWILTAVLTALLTVGSAAPVPAYAASKTSDAAASKSSKKAAKKKKRRKKYTKYNGVDLSEIYDFDYYVKHNKYARKHFKNKPKEAIRYFGRYAIRRGTRAKEEYSKKRYRKLYKKTHPFPDADRILDKLDWNLRAAFEYAANFKAYHGADLKERNRPYRHSSKWYFNYLHKNNHGNCYCKSGTFTILATEMGYECTQIGGLVPYTRSAGPHSWMEIKYKGELRVCDPSFWFNTQHRGGWMIRYGQKGTYRYTDPHRMRLR